MFTGDYGLINKTIKNDFFKFMAEKKSYQKIIDHI